MVSLTRPLTVLFHELGHAVPAILLTQKKSNEIYLVHGIQRSFKINIGLHGNFLSI